VCLKSLKHDVNSIHTTHLFFCRFWRLFVPAVCTHCAPGCTVRSGTDLTTFELEDSEPTCSRIRDFRSELCSLLRWGCALVSEDYNNAITTIVVGGQCSLNKKETKRDTDVIF
jgi:hypothetical protein